MSSSKQTSLSSYFEKKSLVNSLNNVKPGTPIKSISKFSSTSPNSPSPTKSLSPKRLKLSTTNDKSLEKLFHTLDETSSTDTENQQANEHTTSKWFQAFSKPLPLLKRQSSDSIINNESCSNTIATAKFINNSNFQLNKNSDEDSKHSDDAASNDEIEDESEDENVIKVSTSSPEGKNALEKLIKNAKETAHSKKISSKKKISNSAHAAKINWFACKVTNPSCGDISSSQFDPVNYPILEFIKKTENTQFVLFEFLSTHFDKIYQIKGSGPGSKKSITVLLTNVFRCLIFYSPEEIIFASLISLNQVAPNYSGIEVGVGEALILKAMAEAYGKTESSIKKEMASIEDLGAIAEMCSCKMRTLVPLPRLTISSTFALLKSIAETYGHNSQQKKKDLLKRLLVSARGSEPKYIIRFLQQTMRIGIKTATIYQALAFAFWITKPNTEIHEAISDIRKQVDWKINDIDQHLIKMDNAVKTALAEVPSIEVILDLLLRGADDTSLPTLCVITPGIPVQPMLAKPSKGMSEVLDRFSNSTFTCEFKYDGERAQLHMTEPGKYRVFSRRLEEITTKYPDIIKILSSSITEKAKDFIIDSEVVAYDTETDKILPFQVLSTRKRKLVEPNEIKVNIMLFPFDCLRLNGQSLLPLSLRERRVHLFSALKPTPGRLSFASHKEMTSVEEMDSFLQEAIESSCEGLMVKTLDENATYEPFRRSLNWLKVKKDYIEGLTDSIDLVPIGAYYGRGKRNSLFGTYLLAIYNDIDETFQTACKAATGFTDEDLQTLYAYHKTKIIPKKSLFYEISDKLEPDVWLEATQVWECRAADLSLSPVHTAAIGMKVNDKGIGLRFPRFIKVREDKGPTDATNNIQIIEMYEAQFENKKPTSASKLELKSESEDLDE